MADQVLQLLMAVPDEADAGDKASIYWDEYDGTVDYASPPLNRAPIDVFPGQIRARGYGKHPYGRGRLNGQARRAGVYGLQRYGVDPYGNIPPRLVVAFRASRGYGQAKFGLRMYDQTGQSVFGGVQEFTGWISTDNPTPVNTFTLDNYDAGTDTATFDVALATEAA